MLSALFKSRRPSSTYSSAAFDSRYDDRTQDSVTSDDEVLEEEDEEEEDDNSVSDTTPTRRNANENTPLLPIFAANLDYIPVYTLVHWIREEISNNVDTALSYEQLRTPQVSSFVVKPILSNLLRQMSDKSSKAAYIYALMANCLQFHKESEENLAMAGTNITRSILCEILAVKLLKEFTSRELIDALSYDFYPLQGMPTNHFQPTQQRLSSPANPLAATRISALELAIRAQAKKFLSHPMVVQHLQSIWTGNIVFHSAYDRMYKSSEQALPFRRRAVIYDASNASLFKLSRLRVPRYRHLFSTVSLAILLILHLMVLVRRSYRITVLEMALWVWSFGFIMDEIADFNESGVALYFMSMWNAFDFSIFVLFMTFYVLRIIGLFMPNDSSYITDWSFDVLAACSIFLYPRIFSVLDNYRYFSQLIIAFRIMMGDMLALLVLIVVSCSGFFVAFTFSFARDYYSAKDISFALFQMIMGFTPAAWESWPHYNLLGKTLLVGFLIITHFLVITILITVLTNSFAAVAANSVEEHQFLVAVNTISLVKNEAIFTYLAPMNLIAWLLHPLRWFMPFRSFVRLNRTLVKITHLPILASILVYERTIFSYNSSSISSKSSQQSTLRAFKTITSPSPHARRKASVSSHQRQELVLDQVFARPFHSSGKGAVVNDWMNNILSSSPPEADRTSRLSRDPYERSRRGRAFSRFNSQSRAVSRETWDTRAISKARSAAHSTRSDPEEFLQQGMDADADNEGETMEEETVEGSDVDWRQVMGRQREAGRYSAVAEGHASPALNVGLPAPTPYPHQKLWKTRHHQRSGSNNTVVHNPIDNTSISDDDTENRATRSGQRTPASGKRTPKLRPRTITIDAKTREELERERQGVWDVPNSFQTRMEMAQGNAGNRMVLARMRGLEESLGEIRGLVRELVRAREDR
ncbi:hypothetical protein BZA77DRAFT_300364 [Pyronema omphalodes]|nr:hypothetical protein BZA77DRAFT_300364 [Pyronema omphalodes]